MKLKLFFFLLAFASIGYGQKLRFKVEGAKDTTVFLTKYLGSKLFYADTGIMKGGVVEFSAKPDLKGGMLALLLPGQKYFEFVYNKEDISLETKLPDMQGNLKVKKSAENMVFVPYVHMLSEKRKVGTDLAAKRDASPKDSPEYKKYTASLDSLNKTVLDYQNKILKDHSNLLVAKIIKMGLDVQVPESPKDASGKEIDPNFRFLYFRAHFWDNIDLKDDRLVNVPIFQSKLEYFFGKNMVMQQPDSILNIAFPFCDQFDKKSDMFRFCVDHITNTAGKSNIMNMDKVYVMMVDRYYCSKDPATGKSYATWIKEDKLKELCDDNAIKKNLVYGVVPPNVILLDTTDKVWKDFYSLKSEYTILYFWDPECGHCKKVTPKLQTLYEKKLKARNVEVFAIGKATDDDFEKWKKFIRENKLSFINVGLTKTLLEKAIADPNSLVPVKGDPRPKPTTLESLNYHDTYDVYATPKIFVLDKDKKIIAKQLTISQLEDMLDKLQNVKDPEKLFPPDPEEEAH